MPDIDQIFDRLRGKRVFSTVVDMSQRLFPDSSDTQLAQELFSFPTPFGWWFHRRLPMGYKNAGAEFWSAYVSRVRAPGTGRCLLSLSWTTSSLRLILRSSMSRDVQRVLEALRVAGFRTQHR